MWPVNIKLITGFIWWFTTVPVAGQCLECTFEIDFAVHRTFWHLLFINHCRFPRASLGLFSIELSQSFSRIPLGVAGLSSALHPAASSVAFCCPHLTCWDRQTVVWHKSPNKTKNLSIPAVSPAYGLSYFLTVFKDLLSLFKISISSALYSKFFILCPSQPLKICSWFFQITVP